MLNLEANFDGKNESTPKDHYFIQFGKTPKIGLNSHAAFIVVDHYLKARKQSRKVWRRDKQLYNVNWSDPKGNAKVSKSINYLEIANYVRANGYFHPNDFDLPPMECFWLDVSFPIKMDFHVHDATGTLTMELGIPQQQYGTNFPMRPRLQREGHLYGSFQPQLIRRIISLRQKLIAESNLAIKDEWIFDLRALISDCVSLVDIALNQIYIKAEYDPIPGWKFDKSKLGDRHGRRLNDKLKWVFKIVGRPLNIQPEMASLTTLREIRNHLMHFDPPCLVITIEEAVLWLNQIIDVGLILIKIRKAIGVEISSDLVDFILQKEAVFCPKHIGKPRKPLGHTSNEDYYSSTWP